MTEAALAKQIERILPKYPLLLLLGIPMRFPRRNLIYPPFVQVSKKPIELKIVEELVIQSCKKNQLKKIAFKIFHP